MSEAEANWLSDFCARKRINVVLRSRAEESIRWISEKGAMLKPSWIKSKGVTWADVKYLGLQQNGRRPGHHEEAPAARRVRVEAHRQAGTDQGHARVSDRDRAVDRAEQHVLEGNQADACLEQTGRAQRQVALPGERHRPPRSGRPLQKLQIPAAPRTRSTRRRSSPKSQDPRTRKWGSITGDIDLVSVHQSRWHVIHPGGIRENPQGTREKPTRDPAPGFDGMDQKRTSSGSSRRRTTSPPRATSSSAPTGRPARWSSTRRSATLSAGRRSNSESSGTAATRLDLGNSLHEMTLDQRSGVLA